MPGVSVWVPQQVLQAAALSWIYTAMTALAKAELEAYVDGSLSCSLSEGFQIAAPGKNAALPVQAGEPTMCRMEIGLVRLSRLFGSHDAIEF